MQSGVCSTVGRRRARWGAIGLWVGVASAMCVGVAFATLPVATTRVDFFEPGTQPMQLDDDLVEANTCSFCHAGYDADAAPWDNWRATMMAQSARDPVFHAALKIAENDAAFAGDSCLRCHSPVGWLRGHVSGPGQTDGSGLEGDDFDGVSCSACHRMVDPIYISGVSPYEDEDILMDIVPPALADAHSGSFVIDPKDRRRGPFDLDLDWMATPSMGWPGFHSFIKSNFHTSSRLCASCHDVSLPHYTKQPDGSYDLNALNTEGPSKHLQFPEQRTYSEWAKSLFATAPVDLDGRFGGTRAEAVSSCQDCHMPGVNGEGCGIGSPPNRPAVPRHTFAGSNTWVLRAVRSLYPDPDTGLDEQAVNDAIARNIDMLQRASDLELTRVGTDLITRVINFTGHKLPTGYPEGRRIWVNVKFFDGMDQVVAERGAYDLVTATLAGGGADTTVYEAIHGIDAHAAALTGLPVGPLFRLALVNTKYKDNRIPPMGYTLANFESVGAAPVPSTLYADGQYWHDSTFTIPAGAVRAEVRVMHQTSTREYMEFLRDALPAPNNDRGQIAYDQWVLHGKSAPTEMDFQSIDLSCTADFDNDGDVDVVDLFDYLDAWFAQTGTCSSGCSADIVEPTGSPDVVDLFDFLDHWFLQC